MTAGGLAVAFQLESRFWSEEAGAVGNSLLPHSIRRQMSGEGHCVDGIGRNDGWDGPAGGRYIASYTRIKGPKDDLERSDL